ncbi:hypothetical protein IKR55_01120 [bacterium]|nr:hypothetical protein [bacterium]
MKVEQIQNYPQIKQIQSNNKDNKVVVKGTPANNTPNFTGAFDMMLRFLDTNPAWGADAVDLCFMVIPRTLTDFGRGADAGFETMRRESLGTINHSMIPVYGTITGALVASALNNAYFDKGSKIKSNKIHADSETLDLMGKLYKEEIDAAKGVPEAKPLKNFLVKYFNSYEALSPTENGKYISLEDVRKAEDGAKSVAEEVAEILAKEIEESKDSPKKDILKTAKAKIVSALGVENNFRIKVPEGTAQHASRYTLDTIIDNAYKLGFSFDKDSIKQTFIDGAKDVENAFIKSMKKMNIKRSLFGLGIASLVGISAQPFNMWLTRKKTGATGFVGGGEEDKSLKFKIKKTLVGLAFLAGALYTIGNPKNIITNLQFKGANPTLNQFKFVYGITIFSRFLSARNDNELAETSVKDTLGFANWLILGNFVQKLAAQAMDKDLIKRDGTTALDWIRGSVLKSRDEILHEGLERIGDKAKAFKDGKALNYKELAKLADSVTKVKLRKISIAQLINYAYTGLVLGVGIPKLNIYLTGRREAKKAAEKAAKEASSQQQTASVNVPLTGSANNMLIQKANAEFMNKAGMV